MPKIAGYDGKEPYYKGKDGRYYVITVIDGEKYKVEFIPSCSDFKYKGLRGLHQMMRDVGKKLREKAAARELAQAQAAANGGVNGASVSGGANGKVNGRRRVNGGGKKTAAGV